MRQVAEEGLHVLVVSLQKRITLLQQITLWAALPSEENASFALVILSKGILEESERRCKDERCRK